jgi:manganese transport system substrate-binding protein
MRMLVLLVLIGYLCTACSSEAIPGIPNQADTAADAPKVITTYSVLYDLTRKVAGERAEVSSLVPVGVDPHTYEPTPGDLRRVSEADLIIYNGFGLEVWFNKLIEAAGKQDQVVVASEFVTPYLIDAEGPFAGLPDPHAWMDPSMVMKYVERIRDALIDIDPQGSEVYIENAKRFYDELAALDSWIRQEVQKIPPENRKLVTTENAMRYFAEAYDFEIVGWIYTLAPEEDIPARRLANLIEQVRQKRVPALFVDITLNPRMIERVSEETGAPIAGSLYIDSLSEPGEGADTYLAMMRANVELLVEGLGGRD